MKKFAIIAAVAALTISSCKTMNSDLANQTFRLTELNGKALVTNADVKPAISFEKGRVNATVGCNSIFGVCKLGKDGSITIKEGGATKMMCPDNLREDEFLAAFNKVAKYTVSGNKINFCDATGKVLFTAEK